MIEGAEVILFGEGKGFAETAADLGIAHVPAVESSDTGIPFIRSMFAVAERQGRHDIQMYVNCDIVLLEDLAPALQRIRFAKFLMVGQRWDMDITGPLAFGDPRWAAELRDRARTEGARHRTSGVDYFAFRRGMWGELPPMVVGRVGYDNWLIWYARKRGIPVVDASDDVLAIHQNHDFSHVEGGRATVESGPDAQRNLSLVGDRRCLFDIHDADWRLEKGTLRKNRARGDWRRDLKFRIFLRPWRIDLRAWLLVRRALNLLGRHVFPRRRRGQ
ncbi:MAG: hypothetical protein JXR37_25725 [Kiritimatiellae bacterium]|nr:hypothetical protein [Kiritimatiellia bacterium]